MVARTRAGAGEGVYPTMQTAAAVKLAVSGGDGPAVPAAATTTPAGPLAVCPATRERSSAADTGMVVLAGPGVMHACSKVMRQFVLILRSVSYLCINMARGVQDDHIRRG